MHLGHGCFTRALPGTIPPGPAWDHSFNPPSKLGQSQVRDLMVGIAGPELQQTQTTPAFPHYAFALGYLELRGRMLVHPSGFLASHGFLRGSDLVGTNREGEIANTPVLFR